MTDPCGIDNTSWKGTRTSGAPASLVLRLSVIIAGILLLVCVLISRSKISSSSTGKGKISAPHIVERRTIGEANTLFSTPQPSPSLSPLSTPAPTASSRLSEIKSFLIQQNVSQEQDLETEGSPQQRVLDFIAINDPLELPIPSKKK